MKRNKWKLYGALCFLFMTVMTKNIDLEAAGTVTIFLDHTSINVEDMLNVSVKTSDPSDDALPPQVSLTFDPQLLELTYCSVSYGGGDGGLITLSSTDANLSFRAKKAGTASFEAEAVIDEDGNHKATASKSVSITGSEAETAADQPQETTRLDELKTSAGTQGQEDAEESVKQAEAADNAGDENGTAEETLSSNAYLKKFKVTEAKLRPKFSKEITDYTITLKEDNKQLIYTAKTEDKNASIVSASGFSNLKNGLNRAVLNVRAQDGTMMMYTFTIIKEGAAASTEDTTEREVAKVTDGLIAVKDSELYVHTTFPVEMLPEGCIKTEYVYKEQYVEAACFDRADMMILYLSKKDGTDADFYLYYSGTDEFMDFVQIKGAEGQFIFPIQFPIGVVIPDGFQDAVMQWGDQSIPAFVISKQDEKEKTQEESDEAATEEETGADAESEDILPGNIGADPEDFYLLYAMNQEGGEGFYLYDSLEGTYQRFLQLTDDSDVSLFDEENYVIYKHKSQKRMVVIGILTVVIVILLFLLFNLWLQIREMQGEEEEDDEEDEDDEKEEKADSKSLTGKDGSAKKTQTAMSKKEDGKKAGELDAEEEDWEEVSVWDRLAASYASFKKKHAEERKRRAEERRIKEEIENGVESSIPAEEIKLPDKENGKPSEEAERSERRQGKPAEEAKRPEKKQGKPSEETRRPDKKQGKPSEETRRPEKKQGKPAEEARRLEKKQGKPAEEVKRPEKKQGKPAEEGKRPEKQQEKSAERMRPAEEEYALAAENSKQDQNQRGEEKQRQLTGTEEKENLQPEEGLKKNDEKNGQGKREIKTILWQKGNDFSRGQKKNQKIQKEVQLRLDAAMDRKEQQTQRSSRPIMFDLKIDDNLTPKMQREKLDDDFEFEFINIDED